MTRGQFVLVTNDGIFSSGEFNGDMYYDGHGHGPEVVERLMRIQNADDFDKELIEFNEANFEYEDYQGGYKSSVDDINFKRDYFGEWFSDYLYIKNLTDSVYEITDRDGKTIMLNPDQIQIFCFGRLYGNVDSDGHLSFFEEEE